MKIYQSWKRNEPSSVSGESITLTIIYTSFKKEEIDEVEKRMPKGILVVGEDDGLKHYDDGSIEP